MNGELRLCDAVRNFSGTCDFVQWCAGSLESRPTGPPAKIHGFSTGHPFRQKESPRKNMSLCTKCLASMQHRHSSAVYFSSSRAPTPTSIPTITSISIQMIAILPTTLKSFIILPRERVCAGIARMLLHTLSHGRLVVEHIRRECDEKRENDDKTNVHCILLAMCCWYSVGHTVGHQCWSYSWSPNTPTDRLNVQ